MTDNIFEVEADFYHRCAEILKIEYSFQPYFLKKTRWNRRDPGNGRFIGYGLIRRYGGNNIHIMLTKPKMVNKMFNNEDQVFLYLKELVKIGD